ncbi:Hypothetical predicted protein [Mytilus galloprovincialis]|uniref:Uncharacterized protein n=1 Tax=Mytilus galloprovincialis TaxID=29158 RepID=A0A8B6GED4_MYTGA|nr:Hypothetical predicted protein [Mytilus galloprovincialis]
MERILVEHGIDPEIAANLETIRKTELKIKHLQDNRHNTDTLLSQATKDLRFLGVNGDKDDIKLKVRQKLLEKKELVNEMENSAYLLAVEIQKTDDIVHKNTADIAEFETQYDHLDQNSPLYLKMEEAMINRGLQNKACNILCERYQFQLKRMLNSIEEQTDDITKLQTLLNDGK